MAQATLAEGYNLFVASLSPMWRSFLGLFIIVIFITLYAIFILKIYKWVATKNILELNLKQYNTSSHPVWSRLAGIGLYLLEYIIILPILVFVWFVIFTIFLIVSAGDIPVATLLVISAAVIASIRMTAYYKKSVSAEVAKLLPLNLLAVSILTLNFLNVDKILSNLSQIPGYFGQILSYLLFIVVLEIVLRLFDFIISIFNLKENTPLPKIEDLEKEVDENN